MRPFNEAVTAIVCVHNRRDLVIRSLSSLLSQEDVVIDPLVIDNASTDGTPEAIVGRFGTSIQIVRLRENLGSAGGFGLGMEIAQERDASYLLLLDSDVLMPGDTVATLLETLRHDAGVGAVGPKVYRWGSSSLIQEMGGWIDWKRADLRRNLAGYNESSQGPVNGNSAVDYLPACCFLTRREMLDACGPFESDWFLYWDDIDWFQKVGAAGATIICTAAASINHYGGGGNKPSLVPVYYGWRNRVRFFKSRTPIELRTAVFETLMEDFLRAQFTCEVFQLHRTGKVMAAGFVDGFRGLAGTKDFSDLPVYLDTGQAERQESGRFGGRRLVAVEHVIGDAPEAYSERTDIVLEDRFGKRLPAPVSWNLRRRWEREKEERKVAFCHRHAIECFSADALEANRMCLLPPERMQHPAMPEAMRATSRPR